MRDDAGIGTVPDQHAGPQTRVTKTNGIHPNHALKVDHELSNCLRGDSGICDVGKYPRRNNHRKSRSRKGGGTDRRTQGGGGEDGGGDSLARRRHALHVDQKMGAFFDMF